MLRCFNVPGDHGGRITRVEHRSFRHDQIDRLQAPGIQRNVIINQRSEDIKNCCPCYRRRCVEVVIKLIGRTGEIDRRRTGFLMDRDLGFHHRTIIHFIGKLAVFEHINHPANAFLGIVLHVAHIGMHNIKPEVIDHLAQFLHALFIGGNLCAQIGDVLIRVTCRVFRPFQKGGQTGFVKLALINQFEIVDQNAFFLKNAGIWRHRARGNPANIGMVATRCDIEQDFLAIIAKDRRD